MDKKYSRETLCVQAGWTPKKGEPRVLPIYQSTTFKYDTSEQMARLFDLEDSGYFYTRLQNPTNDAVAAKIAALEGGVGAMLTSSGQAANFYAIFNICQAGDHFVCSSTIYGGTFNLFGVTLKKLGIECTFIDANASEEEIDQAFRPNTKALFGETISNPSIDVLDIEKFARIAHKHGVPLIVDNTFATPINCRPFEWGADIVTHSTTKYMDGHATSVGGAIVDSGQGWLDIRPEGDVPLAPGDGFVIDAGEDRNEEQGGRIWKVQRNRLFFHGKASGIDWSKVRPGQKLWKTDDPALNAELKKMREHLPEAVLPLHLACTGSAGAPLTVSCPEYGCSVLSAQPLQTAEKRPLTPEVLEQQLGRLGGTGFRLASCECRLPEGLMLPLSILNQTRRALVEQIQTVRQEREASVPTRLPEPFVLPALPAGAATPDAPPHLSVLCRRPEQIPSVLDAGADAVYLDFEDLRDYAAGVEAVRRHTKSIPVFLATPRIQKPSETGYFKLMERAEPDGVLIRNLGAAQYFRHSPLHRIGDFSLNVANPYSAAILKEGGNLDYLTISYDLNAGQVEDLLRAAPPEWFELTLHQHMPMFHMEHCVFCTFLSDGSSYKNCGRPCERYHVQLRDRVGQLHPLLADAGCRNTLFNGRAQTGAGFFRSFRHQGLSRFRVELLDDSPEKARLLVSRYRELLDGSCTAARLIRELDVAEQLGTTEGTLRPR